MTFKKLLSRAPNAHDAQCQHDNIEARAGEKGCLGPSLVYFRFMSAKKHVPKRGLSAQTSIRPVNFFLLAVAEIPQMVILKPTFEGPENMRRPKPKEVYLCGTDISRAHVRAVVLSYRGSACIPLEG